MKRKKAKGDARNSKTRVGLADDTQRGMKTKNRKEKEGLAHGESTSRQSKRFPWKIKPKEGTGKSLGGHLTPMYQRKRSTVFGRGEKTTGNAEEIAPETEKNLGGEKKTARDA